MKQSKSLEVAEVVLVKCNLADNQYQKKSKVLQIFMNNKEIQCF